MLRLDTPLPGPNPTLAGHAPQTGIPTVLLVEDSATQRRIVRTLLEDLGSWNVVQATDGLDALEQIEQELPNVILTDVYMPGMDGLALVEQVRERYPQIPVVLMTARGSEQLAVSALKAGAADYAPKRALAVSVGAILERVLANAQAERRKLRLRTAITGRVTRFEVENDASLVPPLVAQLREDMTVMGVGDANDTMRVGIALEEALLNAIYHGNLEVSSDLKANGDGPFLARVAERRNQDPYRARRVRIMADVTQEQATFVIGDEGPGFDVSKLPDPTDPEYLERPSGRGLLLMRAFLDDVQYNSVGNQVTLVKRRSGERGA